jgi:arginase
VDGTLTPPREVDVVALLCRTSDRVSSGSCGAEALATTLAGRAGALARLMGSPGTARAAPWEDDLRDAHVCLLDAAGVLDDALGAGRFPVLLASDCSICVSTLPALARRLPDVRVLWLDAHGDFNTPATTISGFLGGMCLAAACGRWSPPGLAGPYGRVDPARVHLVGVRDLDPGERDEVAAAGVRVGVPEAGPVYVHLDCDVLDPSVLSSQFPVPGGMNLEGLGALLAGLGDRVVGIEVTALEQPEQAARIAGLLDPLLR